MNPYTQKAESVDEWLELLRSKRELMDNVTFWHTEPAKPARTAELPVTVHPKLAGALGSKGITQL